MIQSSNYSESFNNSLAVYSKIFHIDPNVTIGSNMQSSVTSMPRRVCFRQQKTINCTAKLPYQKRYPGERFTIQVAIVGQLNGLVPGIVGTEFKHNQQDNSLAPGQKIQRIDGSQNELTYTVYSNQSRSTRSNVTLVLAVQQSVDDSVLIHIPKADKVDVEVHLKECPLGFELSKKKPYSCICNTLFRSEEGHISCNITTRSIHRHSQIWLGYYEENGTTMIVFSKYCPLDYCKKSNLWINVTDENKIDQDYQCCFNRTGLLCGQCPHSMSISLSDSTCRKLCGHCPQSMSISLSDSTCRKHCSNYGLFKVILFLGLGIVAIALLILLNITITEGTISGITFYANVLQVHKSAFFSR